MMGNTGTSISQFIAANRTDFEDSGAFIPDTLVSHQVPLWLRLLKVDFAFWMKIINVIFA